MNSDRGRKFPVNHGRAMVKRVFQTSNKNLLPQFGFCLKGMGDSKEMPHNFLQCTSQIGAPIVVTGIPPLGTVWMSALAVPLSAACRRKSSKKCLPLAGILGSLA